MEASELREFFEDNGIIMNPFEVEIDSDLEYVNVCSLFPGYQEKDKMMSVELTCYCETMVDFICLFNLTSTRDLESITPEFLQSLYEQGNAEIAYISHTYTSRILFFRKQEKSLFARTEDFLQHKVATDLTTPDDFIAYSKNYLNSLQFFDHLAR